MLPKKIKRASQAKKVFYYIIIAVLITTVSGFLIYSNIKTGKKRAELNAKIESIREEIRILEEKNAQLKEGVSESQSQDYLEKMARDNLSLKKPGEEAVAVKQSASATEQASSQEKSFWDKIKEKIGF